MDNGSEAKFRRTLYNLFAVAATLEVCQREFARKIEVAPSQFMMLRIVAEGHRNGGTTVTKIAKNLFLHNSFVVLQTGRLVEMGLVKRLKNPDDMRSSLLHLTAKGEATISCLNDAVVAANDTLFGWMSRPEFERFSTIIEKMAQQGPATLSGVQLTPAASLSSAKGAGTPNRSTRRPDMGASNGGRKLRNSSTMIGPK